MSKTQKFLENISAISAQFQRSIADDWYEKHAHKFGGFPGVWAATIDAAREFTRAELRMNVDWGNGHEYPQAIDKMAALMASHERPESWNLRELAEAAIAASAY